MKNLKTTKKLKKLLFSTSLLIMIYGGFICQAVTPGMSVQKTYNWNYKVNPDAMIEASNYDCDIVIHTWDKAEAEYRLIVDADARSEDDASYLNDYLSNLVFSHSTTGVSFDNRFWSNRNSILGRTTIKLKNGKTITLSSFDMKGELWIPKGCSLVFSSKYSEIKMDNFSGPARIDLYNDNFYGNNMDGKTEITDKYSTIEFKDINDLKANLYNSRLNGGNSGDLDIESKYSRITFRTTGNIKINGYNDKYNFSRTGDITIAAKYTDLKADAAGNADINYYEGTVAIGTVKDLDINSKYADYDFDVAGKCTISSSYNDRLSVSRLNSLAVNESRYCSYKIDNLTSFLTESEGYNDKFSIGAVGSDFSKFRVNGKYLEISLGIPKNMDYRFKANITYADLDINESSFKPVVKIIQSSKTEYDAVKGTEKEGMPLIEAEGYQVSLKIREY
ncbi:MAG TPA: hypothetical protein VJ963_04130 [Bacteroidales bacterium]|nr:hypothetical protein [Bacteroidales bacterium]